MVIYSHSRLSTFEQCPRRFKFQYIDKLQPDIVNTIEGFLGSTVHDTLEHVYIEKLKGNLIELDQAIEHFALSWNNKYTPEIKVIKPNLTQKDYFEKGIKFIINYFNSNYPFDDNTIETEKRVLINLDPEGKYKLQGYIDRLVHHKDSNNFEIHDYKTGAIKTQEQQDKDRQLALYAIGIKQLFNEVNDIDLVWHFLDFNKKIISKRTEQELENLKKDTIDLIKKIESTTEFPAKPSILCKWCGFRSYCDLFNKKD